MSDTLTPHPRPARLISLWLFAVTGFLVAMIVVGGATRLTDSGLSITEWKPVSGVLPPLSAEAWQKEFAHYRQIPEYKLQNRGMTLAQFKGIFWWEWSHRLLGRLIGFVVLIPLLIFAARRQIPPWLGRRLVLLLGLGALQGFIGWWMVSSGLGGLGDRLDVTATRLAVHMGMALIILGLAFWTALDARAGGPVHGRRRPLALGFAAAVWVQAVLGALVAGNDGGYVNNTWPLMDGGLLPRDYAALHPLWRNMLENPAAAQFDHRLGAYLLFALALFLAAQARRSGDRGFARAALLVAALVSAQLLLGIWTVLMVTPLPLGLAHQALGVMVFLSAINLARLPRQD